MQGGGHILAKYDLKLYLNIIFIIGSVTSLCNLMYVCGLVRQSVIIFLKYGKLHFNAPIIALVIFSLKSFAIAISLSLRSQSNYIIFPYLGGVSLTPPPESRRGVTFLSRDASIGPHWLGGLDV